MGYICEMRVIRCSGIWINNLVYLKRLEKMQIFADAVDYKLISLCHRGDIVVSQDYGETP